MPERSNVRRRRSITTRKPAILAPGTLLSRSTYAEQLRHASSRRDAFTFRLEALAFVTRPLHHRRMEINVQAISLVIAVWGAITGSTALTLNLVTFFMERARLKLAWLKGYVILTVGPQAPATESEEQYARLIVTNLGRKSLRVTGAYGMALDSTGAVRMFLFSDGLIGTPKDRVLTPEQPSTEFHVREDVIPEGLFLLAVSDGFGKTHRLWLVPRRKRAALKRKVKRTMQGKMKV